MNSDVIIVSTKAATMYAKTRTAVMNNPIRPMVRRSFMRGLPYKLFSVLA